MNSSINSTSPDRDFENLDIEFKVFDSDTINNEQVLSDAQSNFDNYIAPIISTLATAVDAATGTPIFKVLTELTLSIARFQYANNLVKNRCMMIANFLHLYTNELEVIKETVTNKENYKTSEFSNIMKKYELKCTELFLYLLEKVFSNRQLALIYEKITGKDVYQTDTEINSLNEELRKIIDTINDKKNTSRYNLSLPMIENLVSKLTVPVQGSSTTLSAPVANWVIISDDTNLTITELAKTGHSLLSKMVYIINKKIGKELNNTLDRNTTLISALNLISQMITENEIELKTRTTTIGIRTVSPDTKNVKDRARSTIKSQIDYLESYANPSTFTKAREATSALFACLSEYGNTDLEEITSRVEREYEAINAYTHVLGLSYTSFITKDLTETTENLTETTKDLTISTTFLSEKINQANELSEKINQANQELNENIKNKETADKAALKVIYDKIDEKYTKTFNEIIETKASVTGIQEKIKTIEETNLEINIKNSQDISNLFEEIGIVKSKALVIETNLGSQQDTITSLSQHVSKQGSVTIDDVGNKNNRDILFDLLTAISKTTQDAFKLDIQNTCSEMEQKLNKLLTYTGKSELGRTTMIQNFDNRINNIVMPIGNTIYEQTSEILPLLKTLNVTDDKLSPSDVSQQLVSENIMTKYSKLNADTTLDKLKYTLLAVMHKYGNDYNTVRFSILHILMSKLNYMIFQEKLREYVTYNKMFLMSCFDFLTIIGGISSLTSYSKQWNEIFDILQEIPGVDNTDSQREFSDSYVKFIGNSANIDILVKTNIIALSLTTGAYTPINRQPPTKCSIIGKFFTPKQCKAIDDQINDEKNPDFGVPSQGGTRRRRSTTKKLKNYKIKTIRLKQKRTRRI